MANPVGRTVDPANAVANVNYGDISGDDAGAAQDRDTRSGTTNTALTYPGGLRNFDNPPINALVRRAAPVVTPGNDEQQDNVA